MAEGVVFAVVVFAGVVFATGVPLAFGEAGTVFGLESGASLLVLGVGVTLPQLMLEVFATVGVITSSLALLMVMSWVYLFSPKRSNSTAMSAR